MINLPLHYSIRRDSNSSAQNIAAHFHLYYPTSSCANITHTFQLDKSIYEISGPRERLQNFLAETKHKHHCDCYLLNFDEIPDLDNSIRNKLKKITNYSDIRNEFRIIDEWLKFIIGDYKDIDRIFFNKEFLIVRKGIWFSSIILYGKAFVAGKRTNLKDKIKDIFKGNDRLKSVHEDILRYRHNFVAHSKDLDLSRTFLYLSLRIDKKELMDLENFYYRLEELSIDQYKDFQRLVWHVHNWIDNEIVKFDKYIVKEVKEKLNTDDLYKYKLEK